MNNKILIIIPTLNEFGNIQKIYKKIQTASKEINILFIDDNSIDGSKKNSKVSDVIKADKT